MELNVNVNNHITLYPKVSEAWEIWTREKRRSGDLGRENRPRTRLGSVWDGHSETCPGVWLRRKGWSSSEKTRYKGNESVQPKDGPSRLRSKSGRVKGGDYMASDEAHKNIQSPNILSETILFCQPWVHTIDQFLFPRYSLEEPVLCHAHLPPGLQFSLGF